MFCSQTKAKMNPKHLKRISKTMSLALRHRPEVLELQLDAQGWCDVDQLITALQKRESNFDRQLLEQVVAENDKKRFAFSEDGQRIRANQGHSISIELGYQSQKPPTELFHGTATRFLNSIRRQGLMKGQRHHVHLSADKNTAQQVGARHGVIALLRVRSGQMYKDGYVFYQSDNGVWLSEHIPIQYIIFP